ncbi:DUF5348 domain-containing protein [Salibacterium aidingense]|uniref:DUF5348 domain-containing protein n=1 Tax=Salibacterium aidingense TaxID=384933 RepID=UPI000424F7A7|nr:DUF5348 domain-containing protein [Salibacterium aidingense]
MDNLCSLETMKKEFQTLQQQIERVLEFGGGHTGEQIAYDMEDADEVFLTYQYTRLLDQLDDVHRRLRYLHKKIAVEGPLMKQSNGRPAFPDGTELTSGDACELLVADEDGPYWVFTTIEHHGRYYAKAFGFEQPIDGMQARIRR